MNAHPAFGEPRALFRRATHRGLHGHDHIDRQRRQALLLVVTGLVRVCAWATLLLMYIAHLIFPHAFGFTAALFTSVAFVSCISLYANGATDFGQVAASLAQLTAGDAHHDAEATRREARIDYVQIEQDIAQLARVEPGPEGDELAQAICRRLRR
jgi:hypothetical protein